MTSYGYIIMVIVDSCMIWFNFDCIMQLKKSYHITTNVCSRKSATTFGDLPDCLYRVPILGGNSVLKSPHKGPIPWRFRIFFDIRLNAQWKFRLSKTQWRSYEVNVTNTTVCYNKLRGQHNVLHNNIAIMRMPSFNSLTIYNGQLVIFQIW